MMHHGRTRILCNNCFKFLTNKFGVEDIVVGVREILGARWFKIGPTAHECIHHLVN